MINPTGKDLFKVQHFTCSKRNGNLFIVNILADILILLLLTLNTLLRLISRYVYLLFTINEGDSVPDFDNNSDARFYHGSYPDYKSMNQTVADKSNLIGTNNKAISKDDLLLRMKLQERQDLKRLFFRISGPNFA